ncbi:MAG: L-lactate dehydrogenase [Treponema sp.]|jgi:L-lactate dehydrogenase|nr:L-lactate dehydrogenase [Treponema sp.]
MSLKRRVAIIGTGNVGSTTAFALAVQGIVNELVLIDIDERKAEGHAIDLEDAGAMFPVQIKVWANNWEKAAESGVLVLSAGPLPRPDQSRLDTLEDAKQIVNSVIPKIIGLGFGGIIINITNPCDVAAHCVWKKSGLPPERVFGTGTMLDSLRLKKIIAKLAGTAPSSIEGFSLGEHGDSQMVPFSHIRAGGKPFLELAEEREELKNADLEDLRRQVSHAGWEVLLRKGHTSYGIAAAAAGAVRAVLNDEKRILPASVLLRGEYGLSGLHIGVPALIGEGGAEKVIELRLPPEELAALAASASVIKSYIERL